MPSLGGILKKHKKIFKTVTDVDFAAFNHFYPRDEFLQNKHEVQVYFGKSTLGDDDDTAVTE
jgi:hypothetical protein